MAQAQPHSMIADLVDRTSRSWLAHGAQGAQWAASLRQVYSEVVLVLDRTSMYGPSIPDKMRLLLESRWTLKHWGRMELIRFLWGNGIDPVRIRKILTPLTKRESLSDVEGILASLASGKYDSAWYYFSTRYQINLYLDGSVKDSLNDYTRHHKIADYVWEQRLDRRPWPRRGEKTVHYRGGSSRSPPPKVPSGACDMPSPRMSAAMINGSLESSRGKELKTEEFSD